MVFDVRSRTGIEVAHVKRTACKGRQVVAVQYQSTRNNGSQVGTTLLC